ncbi:hypothetical protein PsorP6_007913 [Peronosclerospora sorghi]|uniref:Uncharacterized protein n=1 Tax=Peronosclerospora sorghi TaxID=230839 RepID=A0ACC0WCG7_9STRA|nr:hypothetical protein PsorP6_007913 [Peronosclerospora sorghi]
MVRSRPNAAQCAVHIASRLHLLSMADTTARLLKRQKVAVDTLATLPAEHPSQHLGFYLTRLKNAPVSPNLYDKSLQELLEGEFSSCLLTNYMYDFEWLFTECPRLRHVPVLLVHGERDRLGMMKECREYANVTAIAPPLPIPFGTHHTKMFVALYSEKVRVAIFTANFLSRDWNTKTQGVWYQDFGLKVLADSEKEDENEETSPSSSEVANFEVDLVNYLSTLGDKVRRFSKELERFDFSSARVALVPSVPGVHKGKGNQMLYLRGSIWVSHEQIRRNTDIFVLLKSYQIPRTDNPLICQFSSLGSLDEKWLFGEFAESFLPGMKNVAPTHMPVQALHLIWPSVEDVV